MRKSKKRSEGYIKKRTKEWESYPVSKYLCREFSSKCYSQIRETHEGSYCLFHYKVLKSCHICDKAATTIEGRAWGPPICADCRDKDIAPTRSSSLGFTDC